MTSSSDDGTIYETESEWRQIATDRGLSISPIYKRNLIAHLDQDPYGYWYGSFGVLYKKGFHRGLKVGGTITAAQPGIHTVERIHEESIPMIGLTVQVSYKNVVTGELKSCHIDHCKKVAQ